MARAVTEVGADRRRHRVACRRAKRVAQPREVVAALLRRPGAVRLPGGAQAGERWVPVRLAGVSMAAAVPCCHAPAVSCAPRPGLQSADEHHSDPTSTSFPSSAQRVYVDPAATVIGDVVLGDDVSVWPGTVVRGDVNFIRIGARTNVQDGTIIHVSHDGPHAKLGGFATVIGDDVTIGHKAHRACVPDRGRGD